MSKARIYQNCDELPLECFIKCIVDGDYSALIQKKGEHTQADLVTAWANIYTEYLDINQHVETIYILGLQKEIQIREYNVTAIEGLLRLLRIIHHEGLVQSLRELGYDEPFDPENAEQYRISLMMVENSIAADKLYIAEKQKELVAYMRSRANDTIDRQYFTKMLIRLSRYMGYGIRAKDITVAEFVLMIKDALEVKKAIQSQDGDER